MTKISKDQLPQIVAPCPRCKQEVNVGRSKITGSLILHCVSCGTRFPDAAHEKKLLDTNVISGWNVYARLQTQLELGVPLQQTDFAAAMAEVSKFIQPLKK